MIFVELIYGISIDSFDLINDAYHMLWDCGILLIFLYPMFIAEKKANRLYSFGYGSIEVLGGYVNGIRLLLLALSMIYYSTSRLLQADQTVSNRLVIIAITDFFLNAVGLFLLRDSHPDHLPSKHGKCNYPRKSNLNMRGKSKINSNEKSTSPCFSSSGVYLHVWTAFLNSVRRCSLAGKVLTKIEDLF